jgi:hypothetical protein
MANVPRGTFTPEFDVFVPFGTEPRVAHLHHRTKCGPRTPQDPGAAPEAGLRGAGVFSSHRKRNIMVTVGISRASHLLLICTGAPVFDDFLALVDLAAALCRREGWSRILVDCVSIHPTLTPDELVRIGSYAGLALAGKQVAVVVPDVKRHDGTRSAAASAGGQLRYFTRHPEAASWLAAAAPAPVKGPSHPCRTDPARTASTAARIGSGRPAGRRNPST